MLRTRECEYIRELNNHSDHAGYFWWYDEDEAYRTKEASGNKCTNKLFTLPTCIIIAHVS